MGTDHPVLIMILNLHRFVVQADKVYPRPGCPVGVKEIKLSKDFFLVQFKRGTIPEANFPPYRQHQVHHAEVGFVEQFFCPGLENRIRRIAENNAVSFIDKGCLEKVPPNDEHVPVDKVVRLRLRFLNTVTLADGNITLNAFNCVIHPAVTGSHVKEGFYLPQILVLFGFIVAIPGIVKELFPVSTAGVVCDGPLLKQMVQVFVHC